MLAAASIKYHILSNKKNIESHKNNMNLKKMDFLSTYSEFTLKSTFSLGFVFAFISLVGQHSIDLSDDC